MIPVQQVYVDVDALADEFMGELRVLGAMRKVRQPDGKHYRMGIRLQTQPSVNEAYELAGWLVPELTSEEVESLNIHQVMAIATFAGAGVAGVESLYPNAVRPAEPAPPPGSTPDFPLTT